MNKLVYCISHVKCRKKNWNNREIENLILCNFLPSYSFIELIHILMHNIVLYTSIYLFSWLQVLCNLSSINNDRKHAIWIIFISVFFRTLIFDEWSA